MQTQEKRKDIKMDQTKFNRAFDKADRDNLVKEEQELSNDLMLKKKYEAANMNRFDSRKYTEDLGINLKNLFFDMLEMLANGENPMPHIMDNPQKQFIFAVMIISIGILLLFFSNLMI